MSQISAIRKAIAASLSDHSPLPPLPRLLFSEDLARITGLSITTIRCYTGNKKKFGHLLPKWFKLPGSRRLTWLEADVIAWVKAGQTAMPAAKRPRGRPTKAEQVAQERAGVERAV